MFPNFSCSMVIRVGIVLGVACSANAGYIFRGETSVERMGPEVTIETPAEERSVGSSNTVFYGHQSTERAPNPFAARFGWHENEGVVSCLVPGSGTNSWKRVVQFTTVRGDANNPATGCQRNEAQGVDCINWVEPERLRDICSGLLAEWTKHN